MIVVELKQTNDIEPCQIAEVSVEKENSRQDSTNLDESVGDDSVDSPQLEGQVLHELITIRELLEGQLLKYISRDKAFEKLYEELDYLKRNRAFEDNRSMFIDIALLIDRVSTASKESSEHCRCVLISIQEELLEILDRRDIEVMNEGSNVFDPRYQKAIRTEEVDDESLNNRIVRVLRPGYMFRDIVLRPQEVVLGRFFLA
ncbi:MAG: nucleotide exchange factor GrpE [Candidatus Cloacimonas sp.]|jgi:molecular chaperone GrpE (heat shock protein)|nr:nucleotide exchange factor GrpE [Candidatus Cloacimonas sp.]